MTHVVLCKTDRLLFSTTIFSNYCVTCDCVIEQFMTPYGLVLPTSSNALDLVSRLSTPGLPVHDMPFVAQSPGLLLSEDRLVRTITPMRERNAGKANASSMICWNVYATSGVWAVHDGDTARNDSYDQCLQTIAMLSPTIEDAFETLRQKDGRFNDRGYQIYDVNTLIGWMSAWRTSPREDRKTLSQYMVRLRSGILLNRR